MEYLLDSNIFIQSKNIQYPFDIFPGFWEWLERDMAGDLIASIKPVYKELIKGNDDLSEWVKNCNEKGYFLPVDDTDTQKKFSEIANWVYASERIFKETAKAEFLGVADSWLVAKAAAEDLKIVTLETFDANTKNRVKIPNVCKEFGVEYINTVELIRRLNVKFGILNT